MGPTPRSGDPGVTPEDAAGGSGVSGVPGIAQVIVMR
jgi:hypothetical protein